jgi:hypothetical protein
VAEFNSSHMGKTISSTRYSSSSLLQFVNKLYINRTQVEHNFNHQGVILRKVFLKNYVWQEKSSVEYQNPVSNNS